MKANFIIIKILVHMRVIVETATGYTTGNIKGYGEKEEGGVQMICSSKERETCEVEKLGCKGCFYDSLSNEEVEQCIKELTEVRPEKLDDKGLRFFKAIMQILDEIEELRKQRDYYKARYLEFNNAFIQGGRKLTEE